MLYEASPSPSAFPRDGVLRLVRLPSAGDARVASGIPVDLTPTTPETTPFYATYVTSRFSPDSRFVAYLAPDSGLWTHQLDSDARSIVETFPVSPPGTAISGSGTSLPTVPVWRP